MREWKRGRDSVVGRGRESGLFLWIFFSSFSGVKAESRMLFLRTRSTMIPD